MPIRVTWLMLPGGLRESAVQCAGLRRDCRQRGHRGCHAAHPGTVGNRRRHSGWYGTNDDHRRQERDPSAPVTGMGGAASADHFGWAGRDIAPR